MAHVAPLERRPDRLWVQFHRQARAAEGDDGHLSLRLASRDRTTKEFEDVKHWFLGAAAAIALAPGLAAAQSVERVPNGVLVTPAEGAAKRVRVLVYGDDSFRVTASPAEDLNLPTSLMVVAKPHGDYTVTQANGLVTVKAARASAEIRLRDGHVQFRDAA